MKRVLSFLLCCTLCIGIFAYRPVQVKAVAGVDDAAVVGSMALASYLSATGLELSVIEGGAATVTSGLGAVAGEYAAATGAAASGEAVLGGIAAGTMISTAGTIILSAAAVAACAALAYWLVDTYLVDEEIGTVVDFPLSYIYSSNGYRVIFASNVDLSHTFLDYFIPFNTLVIFDTGYSIRTYISDVIVESSGLPKVAIDFFRPDGTTVTYYMAQPMFYGGPDFSYFGWMITASSDGNDRFFINQVWANTVSGSDGSPVYIVGSRGPKTFSGLRDIIGVSSASKLSASLSSDFNIPEIQPNQQMEITIPSAAPGSTLAELVEIVPQQIADNEFTASYTIDDFASDPDPGTSSMLDYVADIWRKIKALPETISNALKSVFEPDAALLQEITTTFNNKFGWLDVIYQLGVDLCNLEPESQPPVIYIHLEDAEGQFRYGGTEKALDMSWYQPYKEDVDNILSGFMWLAFLWLVFKRAADIINGAGMVSDYEFYTSVPINQPRLGEHKK